MKYTLLALAFSCLLCPATSFSRGVFWTGMYQRINEGSGTQHAQAVIIQEPGRIRPGRSRGLTCRITEETGERTLQFTQSDCQRHGTLIVCRTPATDTVSGRYSGEMCWGDIYHARSYQPVSPPPAKSKTEITSPPN